MIPGGIEVRGDDPLWAFITFFGHYKIDCKKKLDLVFIIAEIQYENLQRNRLN